MKATSNYGYGMVFSLVAYLETVLLCSTSWAGLVWDDHVVDTSYPGGSEWIQIVKDPVASDFGVLACSVGSSDYPLYFYQGAGGSWNKSFVANVGQYMLRGNSFAFEPGTGVPYISYYDGTNVVVTKRSGTGWSTPALVASPPSLTGEGASSLAFNPATGQPSVAFNSGDTAISYAAYDGTNWPTESVVSGVFGFAGGNTQLRFDPMSNVPQVAYVPGTLSSSIAFAKRTSPGSWSTISLPIGSFAGIYDFDVNPASGQPGLLLGSTWDNKFAFQEFDDSAWKTYDVQGGIDMALAYLDDGTPVIVAVPDMDYTGFTVQWLRPGDNEFSTLGSFSYGSYNWPGPLDAVAVGDNLYVAYTTANTGRRIVSTLVPEPGTMVLLAFGGLALIRRRRTARSKTYDQD